MSGKFSGTIKQWWCWPFVTKPPSVRKYMRHTEAHACKFCGSVAIIGGDRLRIGKKRAIEIGEHRHFCDLECAGEYKRHQYQTEQHRQKHLFGPGGQYHALAVRRQLYRHWWVCIGCGYAVRGYPNLQPTGMCVECSKKAPEVPLSVECGYCGVVFLTGKTNKFFCSPVCCTKGNHARRRSRVRSGPRESISILKLMAKHSSKCSECGCYCIKPTGLNLNNEATVDHIIPLAKGGFHVWSNVQLLCRICNSTKRDVIKPGTQLTLPLT